MRQAPAAPGLRRPVVLSERPAQIVLLVRAFEECDREGALLGAYARAEATRRALSVTGLADWPEELSQASGPRYTETVVRRARQIHDTLCRRLPALRAIPRVAELGAGTSPALLLLGLVAGLGASVLGPLHEVQLLSYPLLGILAWNVLLYVVLLARRLGALAPARRRAGGLDDTASRLAAIFLRGAMWRRLHGWRIRRGGTDPQRRAVAKAIVRFGALWHRAAGPLLSARVRRTLHLAAVALVAGALAGLYLRGIVLGQRATWDSALLGPHAVQALLDVLLEPAAVLLGVAIPDVAALRGPRGSGDAAVWVHLYALTALLWIVAPRIGLALVQAWRCHRLADIEIDLRDGYFHRVFTEWRGATRKAVIVPYAFHLEPAATAALKALLRAYLGARADLRLLEPLAHGAEPAAVDPLAAESGPWHPRRITEEQLADREREVTYVVVFDEAKPPEAGVHGLFLRRLRARFEAAGANRRVLVLVDASSYRRHADAEQRAGRLRDWEGVARGAGLPLVEFDPAVPTGDTMVARLRDAAGDVVQAAPTGPGVESHEFR